MDSLSFITLTIALENIYKITIDDNDVNDLASLSFYQISSYLNAKKNKTNNLDKAAATENLKDFTDITSNNPRLLRVVEFIDNYFHFVNDSNSEGARIIPVIGSSGVFRSFNPLFFDSVISKLSHQKSTYRSVNIGLPALSVTGILNISKFIQNFSFDHSIKYPLIVFELDPMMLSHFPPPGDFDLKENIFFSGTRNINTTEVTEFSWAFKSGGISSMMTNSRLKLGEQPGWISEREKKILEIYSGKESFNESSIKIWQQSVQVLSSVSEKIVIFVHPINHDLAKNKKCENNTNYFANLIDRIKTEQNLEFIDMSDIKLDHSDFNDINHVNAFSGRPKITEYIAVYLLSLLILSK
jgi:hypothetical protein